MSQLLLCTNVIVFFSLIFTALGFLHAFGTDEYGQLGVGKPSELGAESNGSNGNNNSNNAKRQYAITHPVFVGGLGEFNVVQVTCGFWSSLAVVEKVGNPRALAPSIISSVLSAATTTTTTTPGQPQQQQPSDEAGDATEISPAATPAAATTAITDDGLSTATAAASASAAGTASGISGISLEHGVQLGPDEGSPYVSSTRLGDETMMAPRLLSQESLVDSGLALPSLSLLMSSSSSALGDDGCLTAEESGSSSLENSGGGGSGTENGESDGDEDKGWRQRNFKLLSKVYFPRTHMHIRTYAHTFFFLFLSFSPSLHLSISLSLSLFHSTEPRYLGLITRRRSRCGTSGEQRRARRSGRTRWCHTGSGRGRSGRCGR